MEEEKLKLGGGIKGQVNDATGGSASKVKSGDDKSPPEDEGTVTLMKMKIRLYRFRDNQWKERGFGICRLLRDRSKRRVHFLMRQDKTKKPVASFSLADSPLCELTPMADTNAAWVWLAMDSSESEEPVKEQFACKFGKAGVEAQNMFKDHFDAARLFNKMAKAGTPDSQLIWADPVEDEEEKVIDDMENKMAIGADDD